MMWNTTCNSTLESMLILPGSEIKIVGPLTFHDLALIMAAASTLVAVTMSLFLIWMHALHYTKPTEQRHIIRILFMVPVYAAASFLSLYYYNHAVYFQVMSDCYEAFAISSFFALMCHYIAPDLHEQKDFFRDMRPIKSWVWPISWLGWCCGGSRKGVFRTPESGLTWFNIIWVGIYQYVFVRVAATITAVVTQYFHKYCESSNSPVFAHVWVLAVVCTAVTIAMFCLIQFYIQMRGPLAEHGLFIKICAIKLVVFLSFWQSTAISIATSQLDIVKPNDVFAYPDIKVGIPSLLLCFEMALFSIMHLWAFPYRPYREDARPIFYPSPGPTSGRPPVENAHSAPAGGPLGLLALWDALNLWDVVKAFGRGIRWLFVGVRHRRSDNSYGKGGSGVNRKGSTRSSTDIDLGNLAGKGRARGIGRGNSTEHLPIANQFRRSKYLGGVSFDLWNKNNSVYSSNSAAALTAPNHDNDAHPVATAATANTTSTPTMVGGLVVAATADDSMLTTASTNNTRPVSTVSPPPPSPGYPRQESAGLIAYAQPIAATSSPGFSPRAGQPFSPYHDNFSSDNDDDLVNHPGVAVPYPGSNNNRQEPARSNQQQQEQQQQPPPQRYGPYGPQRNFSRGPSLTKGGRPLATGPPPPLHQHPMFNRQRNNHGPRGGEDGGMF